MSKFPKSDHCDGELFFNPTGPISKSFRDLLKWRRTSKRAPWPKWVENRGTPSLAATTGADEVVLTFINHVTFLIQTNGLNILTDPLFSLRASPSQWAGPKRVRAPGLDFDSLPRIDAVLVSHNHYDHMDIPALRKLQKRDEPAFFTPLGNASVMASAGLANITETDWWDRRSFKGVSIHTVPAQHWSARGLRDRNRALWCGFVIETTNMKTYFAGDSGYGPPFKDIRKRLGVMDIALLPIGAYEPRWFMKEQHMNPEDAVLAHIDLQARLSIGTHFGTFQLTDEAIDAPVRELEVALKKYRADGFTVMEFGETRRIKAIAESQVSI